MDVVIDTHAFLWYENGNSKLSSRARDVIDDTSNGRYISTACLWEMAIKYGKGKLSLSPSYEKLVPATISANGFEILEIDLSHAIKVAQLGLPNRNHKDPFDRLMIAQGIVEDMPVVSIDDKFDDYQVKRIW